MTSQPLPLPRPPLQERTREGWARILTTGLELLEEGGWEALTIAEVCRRSRVTAPTIYARVDGRAGLFAAVYEYGISLVQQTERESFENLPARGADRIGAVVRAFVRVFLTHEDFLRAVIRYSSSNAPLLERGSQEAQRIIRAVGGAIPCDEETGLVVGRVLFSECLVRVMYGEGFYTSAVEGPDEFAAMLTGIATALIQSVERPSKWSN
jgi:AcrR family transcriptional regulator